MNGCEAKVYVACDESKDGSAKSYRITTVHLEHNGCNLLPAVDGLPRTYAELSKQVVADIELLHQTGSKRVQIQDFICKKYDYLHIDRKIIYAIMRRVNTRLFGRIKDDATELVKILADSRVILICHLSAHH